MASSNKVRILSFSSPFSDLRTDFSLQIAKQLSLKEVEKGLNFVVSPISIHATLNLLASGSTGKTLDQLLSFLNAKCINDLQQPTLQLVSLLSHHNSGAIVLSFANSVWVDKSYPLKPPFKEILSRVYGAEAKSVDFYNKADQVTQDVNSWVENATKGLFQGIFPPGSIANTTILLLANALYFKGMWKEQFNANLTKDLSFHLHNGETIQVPFMTADGTDCLYRSLDNFKVLKLPYGDGQHNGEFCMYFFLPLENNGLKNLLSNTNSDFFNQDFELKYVELEECRIPKFKISIEVEVSETIKELGLVSPFMNLGELSEMVDTPNGLFVSNIWHKSCVEVNEEGTEAAALSYDDMGCSSFDFIPSPPKERPSFVADHPYIFMIREETSKVVLFIGVVLDPSLVS